MIRQSFVRVSGDTKNMKLGRPSQLHWFPGLTNSTDTMPTGHVELSHYNDCKGKTDSILYIQTKTNRIQDLVTINVAFKLSRITISQWFIQINPPITLGRDGTILIVC